LRKGLIAKTPRVTSCAGAAGVGSVFGMVRVYRDGLVTIYMPQNLRNRPLSVCETRCQVRQLKILGALECQNC